jgi:hypothetical protein
VSLISTSDAEVLLPDPSTDVLHFTIIIITVAFMFHNRKICLSHPLAQLLEKTALSHPLAQLLEKLPNKGIIYIYIYALQ